MTEITPSYLSGAQKVLADSLQLVKTEQLIIVSTEPTREVTKYFYKAAESLGLTDLLSVIIPEELRPMPKIPESLLRAIPGSAGLIHIMDRVPGELFSLVIPLLSTCAEQKCKYIYMMDPKLKYMGEGIDADYQLVENKCHIIGELLESSATINVSSQSGTSLTFSLYETIVPRSPIFHQDDDEPFDEVQAPEGEVMTVPLEATFDGQIVINGPVTHLGNLKEPMIWTFSKGQATSVSGDREQLAHLLSSLQASDKSLESLEGIWIAEFAVGTNDWSVLDDNISNCEKVSGTIHFGMGLTERNIGVDRGETFHFDSIVSDASVEVITKEGGKVQLLESGKLMI